MIALYSEVMNRSLAFALVFLATLATAVPALAAPKLQGTHGDWTVYTRDGDGTTMCYAVTQPTAQSPGNVNHGDVFFLVSSWANGAATEQPSLMAGYTFKPNRAPVARVGSTKITMYGADNEAFIAESADEKTLVSKMRAGATMTVQAQSSRGTDVSYSFSLKGITAALRQVKAACG
ncbi:MAG: invasion associated locus B family protein [Litorimonas sp.]